MKGIILFSLIIYFKITFGYQCPTFQVYTSKKSEQTYNKLFQIEGSNMIIATSNSSSDNASTTVAIFDISNNSLIAEKNIGEVIKSIIYSKNANLLITLTSTLDSRSFQNLNSKQQYTDIPSNIIGAVKSSIDDSLIILFTNSFISYYFDLKIGVISGDSFPITPTSPQNQISLSSRDVKLKDFQILAQQGIGRIDLYEINSRDIISSKIYNGSDDPSSGIVAGINGSNMLIASLGTSQLYIWQLQTNSITNKVELSEIISIYLNRYIPIDIQTFIGLNGSSYITVFSGSISIDNSNVSYIFRDTLVYRFIQANTQLELIEAYPFSQLKNSNNFNDNSLPLISDQFRMMSAVVFLSDSQRVYGFSFDSLYMFPLLENQVSQCDFDLDGNNDSYCRLPILINRNNDDISNAFFILNDNNLLIANNELSGFNIFNKSDLRIQNNILPSRMYERCQNCVQSLKNSATLSTQSSSNILLSGTNQIIIFANKFSVKGYSDLENNWEINQGMNMYKQSSGEMIKIDLSVAMSTPNSKIYLGWSVAITYTVDTTIYYCLSYQLPSPSTIQNVNYSTHIDNLKTYFNQHNIECYLIKSNTVVEVKQASISTPFDYNTAQPLQFQQTCEVSYSTQELICIDGQGTLNFWQLSSLVWKKKTTITNCNSAQNVFIYSYQNIPYYFILCPLKISIVDLSDISNINYILPNIVIQHAFISKSILYVGLKQQSQMTVQFYDIDTALKNKSECKLLGQFKDYLSQSSQGIISMDYLESSQSLFIANKETIIQISNIDSTFLLTENTTCELNIYISQNESYTLLNQKSQLISLNKGGQQLSYGSGTISSPFQKQSQIIEGLYSLEKLMNTMDFSSEHQKIQLINFNINLNNQVENVITDDLFYWIITNNYIKISPYNQIQPSSLDKAIVRVYNEHIFISSWSFFKIDSIKFKLIQSSSQQSNLSLDVTNAKEVMIQNVSLHEINNSSNNFVEIKNYLMSFYTCQKVTVDQYMIDKYNITSSQPLFLFDGTKDLSTSKITVQNSFIESDATIINSEQSNQLELLDFALKGNTFCSYNQYYKYVQQLGKIQDAYSAIKFKNSLNAENIDISNNQFCLGSNIIIGSSNNEILSSQNIQNIKTVNFQNNKYIIGAQLQNLFYSFSTTITNAQPIYSSIITGVIIQNNKQINIVLPWKIDPPSPSTSNPLNPQEYFKQKQIQICSYFQVAYILSIDMNSSQLNNEQICGLIEISETKSVKLSSLDLINEQQTNGNNDLTLYRKDPMIQIVESYDVTIEKINLKNQNFWNTVGIKISLEELVGNSININNNTFTSVYLLSTLHYIQVNLIFLTIGYSQLIINLNLNTFSQISVSFSASTQTLSCSCIASNSLVSDIIMNENQFIDTYSDSINGVLVLNAQSITIKKSTFTNNLYSQINLPTLSQDIQVNGAFLKAKTKDLFIEGTTFSDAVTQLGVLYISSSDTELNVKINECKFINLLAFSSGAALYLQGSNSQLKLDILMTLFTNIYLDISSNYKTGIKAVLHIEANQNAVIESNVINLSDLTLENISGLQTLSDPSYFFSVGQAKIKAERISVTRAIVNLTAYQNMYQTLKISNQKQIYSCIFRIFSNSNFQLNESSITEPRILDLIHSLQSPSLIHPALVLLLSNSILISNKLTATYLSINYQGGLLYAQDSVNVQLNNWNCLGLDILYDSSIKITDTIPYENVWNSLLNLKNIVDVQIQNSNIICDKEIDDITGKEIERLCSGRIIQAFESTLGITASLFENYYLQKGNGTSIAMVNMKGMNLLQNVIFKNMKSILSGGAISAYSNFNTLIDNSFQLVIDTCTFFNNTSSKNGGAISFENDPNNVAILAIQLNIKDTIFDQNKALIAACIYFSNFLPSISDISNQFKNNKAAMGNILYSQPRNVKLIQTQEIEDVQLGKYQEYKYNLRTKDTNIQILHASGQKLPTLSFKLYFYDSPTEIQSKETEKEVQLNLLDTQQISQQVHVLLEQYPPPKNTQTQNLPFAVQGSSNVFYNDTGNFIYLNLNIWSEPKSDLNLLVDFSLSKPVDNINNRILQSYTYASQIYMRECSQYETISEPSNIPTINLSKDVSQCNKCPNLTYASEQKICQECPIGATCKQDTNLVIQQQYWRRSFDTYEILHCDENFNSCIGGADSGDNLCAEGYIGALCQECDLFASHWPHSYGKQGQYFCMKCDDMVISYFILFFLSIITILLAIISVKSNTYSIQKKIAHALVLQFRKIKRQRLRQQAGQSYDSSRQRQEAEEEDEKVMESSGAYFKILTSYFQVLGSLSSFNISVPSFFPQVSSSVGNPVRISVQSMDCFLKDFQVAIPYHFYKFILSLTLPIWYYILFLCALFIISKVRREAFQRNHFYSGAVFLFIFLQPDLVQQAINLSSCVQIGQNNFILSNLNAICYEKEHITYIFYLIIPSILILFIIIPIKLFLILRQNKTMLERINFRIKWAFLYHEYTPENYAWEFIKMYEKLIIVIVLSIFNSEHNIKAALMILILIIYTSLLLRHKPFREEIDNQVELYVSISCIVTIVCVVLIIQKSINVVLQVLTMSLMLFVNIVTICIILLRVLMRIHQRLVLSKSKLLTNYPKTAEKLMDFFEIIKKYIFFNTVSLKNDIQALSLQQTQQPSTLRRQDSQSSQYQRQPAQSISNQNFNQNNTANNLIDQSILNQTSQNQQWYSKYRQTQNRSKQVQTPKQNSNEDKYKLENAVQKIKPQKAGISLNKILNFKIKPILQNLSQKQSLHLIPEEEGKSDNVVIHNFDSRDNIINNNPSTNSARINNKNNIFYKKEIPYELNQQDSQFRETNQIILSQMSPFISPSCLKSDGDELITSEKNIEKTQMDNIQINSINDHQEFFVLSQNELLSVQPTPKLEYQNPTNFQHQFFKQMNE